MDAVTIEDKQRPDAVCLDRHFGVIPKAYVSSVGLIPDTRPATGPRVGFVYPCWQALGGVERHTLSLVKTARGVHWSGLAALYPDQVNHEALQALRQFLPTCERPGLRRLMELSDILIVWGFVGGVDEWLRDYRGKVICITHGEGAWSEKQLRQTLPYAQTLVSVSESAVSAFPVAVRQRVRVIHNGIEFDRLAVSGDKATCQRDLGIEPGAFVVGTIGRLSEEKNPLAAAEAVAEMGGNAVALYVGDNGKAEFADKFMRDAERIAPGRIVWHRDVNHNAIGDYFRAMDVFLMASPAEGGPLVSLEAMFAGVPQVATPVGMLPELERRHGPLTWTVPVDPTPEQLAAAIRSVDASDERVRRARDVAIDELSAAVCARQWGELLRDVHAEG